ncbi:hypothetical protein AVEN_158303-1 [Araneus ventricosus]|uniref:Dehydrogenase/reductase SDR family member 11 n=1 Tax=Araneus ventricosus TaxID=182803 RepID=A0A4Y2IF14_ARAVE|nr:hypothetical protein AVEN_158303-1 [Araneus ventricosus]
MERWNGRVVLVTGASSGIGAGLCRALVQHGMTVVGCARRVDRVRAIAEEDQVKNASGKLVAMKYQGETIKKFKMGTYHCGSAAASKVAPSGRGNLHIDTWNAKDPLSQRHLKTKKILFAGDLQPPTSPRVPFTSFDDVQPPKKKENHSVCPSPPTKRPAFLRHRPLRHFPLERSPKFRTRYFVTSQQNCVIHSYFHCRVTQHFLTGPCFAEKRRSTGAGEREKELISSPLLFHLLA